MRCLVWPAREQPRGEYDKRDRRWPEGVLEVKSDSSIQCETRADDRKQKAMQPHGRALTLYARNEFLSRFRHYAISKFLSGLFFRFGFRVVFHGAAVVENFAFNDLFTRRLSSQATIDSKLTVTSVALCRNASSSPALIRSNSHRRPWPNLFAASGAGICVLGLCGMVRLLARARLLTSLIHGAKLAACDTGGGGVPARRGFQSVPLPAAVVALAIGSSWLQLLRRRPSVTRMRLSLQMVPLFALNALSRPSQNARK